MSMVWNTAASVVQNAQQLDKPPLIFTLFFIFLFFFSAIIRHRNRVSRGIPPGTFGWPLIGETLEFLRCQKRGSPHQILRQSDTEIWKCIHHFPPWPPDCGILRPRRQPILVRQREQTRCQFLPYFAGKTLWKFSPYWNSRRCQEVEENADDIPEA